MQIAKGKVYGVETGARLSAADCFLIGMIAKIQKQLTLAVEWLREAERLAEIDESADIYTVQSHLLETIHLVKEESCIQIIP